MQFVSNHHTMALSKPMNEKEHDMKYVLKNIKIVLKNLRLVLQHKEEIENSSDVVVPVEGLNSFIDVNKFHVNLGACSNLNLWLLDYSKCPEIFNYEGKNGYCEKVDLMKYLSVKFSDLYGNEDTDWSNPIIPNSGKLWKNELRWEYLNFLVEELEYYSIHEEVK